MFTKEKTCLHSSIRRCGSAGRKEINRIKHEKNLRSEDLSTIAVLLSRAGSVDIFRVRHDKTEGKKTETRHLNAEIS